jgi:hypothetical protein
MKSQPGALTAILLLTLGLTLASAQNKPNVSGTWKMNPAKSKFGHSGGPEEMIVKFEQKDASLLETFTVSDDHHEHTFELTYTLDGKASTQEVDGLEGEVSATWEGETLVLQWKIEGDIVQRKITLSADGKVMTMAVHYAQQSGETKETVVFDKQ